MPHIQPAANANRHAPPPGLTEADRALLHVVTGWPVPGATPPSMAMTADGRPVLFPPLAAIILDARRTGALQGELTPATFLRVAALLGNASSPRLRLSRAQIGAGFRYLAVETMGFTAGRAGAAAS
jgi:hypothetical protein